MISYHIYLVCRKSKFPGMLCDLLCIIHLYLGLNLSFHDGFHISTWLGSLLDNCKLLTAGTLMLSSLPEFTHLYSPSFCHDVIVGLNVSIREQPPLNLY